GDHRRAEKNLLSGKVTLDNLIPMPKGEARIQATFVISHSREATVMVEQVLDDDDGENVSLPRVVAEFPNLIKYMGYDFKSYEASEEDQVAPFIDYPEGPVGELPA